MRLHIKSSVVRSGFINSVDIMIPLYKAQLVSYLKLTAKPKGLLINFHCENIVVYMVPLVTEVFGKLPKT
jgi:hypothetical protein